MVWSRHRYGAIHGILHKKRRRTFSIVQIAGHQRAWWLLREFAPGPAAASAGISGGERNFPHRPGRGAAIRPPTVRYGHCCAVGGIGGCDGLRKEAPLFAPRLVMRRVVRDIEDSTGRHVGDRTLRYSLGECPWVPDLEVFEEAGRVAIHIDLPGMKPDEVSVTVAGGRVSIQGERRREAAAIRRDLHAPERTYGRFSRTVRLPAGAAADRAIWAFEHGVLRLTVPLENEVAVPAA